MAHANRLSTAPNTGNTLERLSNILLPSWRRTSRVVGPVEFRPARTLDEFKAAARLVYQEYRRRGYVPENEAALRLSIFQALPETTTFIALHRTLGVIGTLTLIQDSPLGLPMDEVYRPELDELRGQGHRLAEVSMLSFDSLAEHRTAFPTLQVRKMALILGLFKAMFDYVRTRTRTTELVACFHPRHEILYEFLCLEPLGGLRPYPMVSGHAAVARHLNILEGQRRAATVPVLQLFYGRQAPPKRFLRKLSFSFEELRELFIESSAIFSTASHVALTYIQCCYPAYQLSMLARLPHGHVSV